MDQHAALYAFVGQWTGTNRLWLPPATAPFESPSSATIAPVIANKFIQVQYTWLYESVPQEGMLLIGSDGGSDHATVVFADSWHMGEAVMLLRGELEPSGTVNVLGSYSVEGYGEWGWRILLEPGEDTWRLAMFNIEPSGQETLGVEAHYVRSSG